MSSFADFNTYSNIFKSQLHFFVFIWFNCSIICATLLFHFVVRSVNASYMSSRQGGSPNPLPRLTVPATCISRLEDGLMHHDPYRTGDVPGYQITNVLRQERVPLPADIVQQVIQG